MTRLGLRPGVVCGAVAALLLGAPLWGTSLPVPSEGSARLGLGPGPSVTPDSTDARREAERRVRQYRRWAWGGGGSRRIRMPVDAIRDERASLIAELDRISQEIPGDDWLLGQRVGFRVLQGRVDGALRVTERCRASPWWCAALRGFVLNVSGDFAGADQAFGRALARMPEEERCRWREALSHLLYGGLGSRYRGADCEERDALARRIWWLADPFQIQPWNDRRAEHYARFVGAILQAHAQTRRRECRGDCGRMALLRGWPSWWWSAEGPGSFPDLPGYRFLPPPEVGLRPFDSRAGDWDLVDDQYHERYNPPYGPIHDLDQQTAVFRRGDSLLVVAVTELDRHILRGAWSLDVGMVLSRGPDDDPVVVRDAGEPARFLFEARVPAQPYLVSVEAVAERYGAARARFGRRPPEPSSDGIAVSEPVLVAWDEEMGEDLDAARTRMLGTERITPDREVGIYWETYGAEAGDELEVTLAARSEDRGLLRRLGEALRIVGPDEPLRIGWRVEGRRDEVEGRRLRVDLSGLEPGPYVLELQVRRGEEEPATSRRHLEVARF